MEQINENHSFSQPLNKPLSKPLNKLTIVLHWIIAFAMLCLFFVGVYMAENEVWSLYPLHKSIGTLMLPVILLRVLWRMKSGWPPVIGNVSRAMQLLSKSIHILLLLLTLMIPLTGMLFSAASGHGFGIFGLELFAANHAPNGSDVIAHSEFWADLGHEMHEILGYTMLLAVGLHVAGALKHHFIDKDQTLLRMLGK